MEKNPMRMHLQKILSLVAGLGLMACAIPDDGFAELSGTIEIPGTLMPLVVMPGDEDSDCDAEAATWGDSPAIGDVSPTVYVGIYKRPIQPLRRTIFSEENVNAWRQGCGDIDHDDDPVTPPIHQEGSCPIGGTTANFVQLIAGTNGGATFEFEALQLSKGDVFLIAWLDNKCRDDNGPTASLVWDMGGPPGPRDNEGDEEAGDENDITITEAIPVSIGSGGNRLDEPLVLNSALTLAGSL